MTELGTLYIVGTPIGNCEDITIRAVKTLAEVDAVICEDRSNAGRLLKKIDVEKKELILLNEHNESSQIENILLRLAQGQNLALISDCGTPLFSDPGHELVATVSAGGFRVVPVPGVSALTTALSVTPLHMKKFHFEGFLPRVPAERLRELKRIRQNRDRVPVILMDTPYRLAALLKDVTAVFGKGHTITICCNLTQPNERIVTCNCAEALQRFGGSKAEFMLIIHP